MKRPARTICDVTTKHGLKIRATGEHPFLTYKDMQELRTLKKGSLVAINLFEGVEYSTPSDKLIVAEDDLRFSKEIRYELKSRGLLPLHENNPKLPHLTKLFGYLLGDGLVYFSGGKGFVNAYGKKEDLEDIQRDLEKIGFSAKVYVRKRNHKIIDQYGTKLFTSENCELHTSSRALAKLLMALGMPTGRKPSTVFLVPNWIMAAPKWIKRLFLASLFGAELSSPKTHTKTGFYSPILSQNKNYEFLANGREFLIQIMRLLKEFGIVVNKISEREEFVNQKGKTYRLRLIISAEENNLLRLWRSVGFEYNGKRRHLAEIASLYILAKKKITEERESIAGLVAEYKEKGLKLIEICKLLKDAAANEGFIRSCYNKSTVKRRLNLDFIGFEEFVRQKSEELGIYGTLFDEIEEIKETDYKGDVYDFTVEDTHNFIANSFVVSNCGMRLIKTNFTIKDVQPKIKELVNSLYKRVPAGVGQTSFAEKEGILKLTKQQFKEVVEQGADWVVKQGYGWKKDLEHIESHGHMSGADSTKISDKAVSRGIHQVGTLGSGNHYLEIQHITKDNIYDAKIAKKFGLFEDQIVIMFHCGSRGFGHQIATDYISDFMKVMGPKYGIEVRDRELVCVPFQSKEGQDYFKAMQCAVNMAFANRQMILHEIRKSFETVFGMEAEKMGLDLIYDVAHNIAKVEEHRIDGKKKELVVHRKGATRCFGPERKELAPIFRETGQPVIVGGSMETGSFLCVGTEKAEETFGSTMHGSGRTMSRGAARKQIWGEKLQQDMEKRGIYVKSVSAEGLAEEAGFAYKDINEVVETMHKAGISKKVVALRPIGNVKG